MAGMFMLAGTASAQPPTTTRITLSCDKTTTTATVSVTLSDTTGTITDGPITLTCGLTAGGKTDRLVEGSTFAAASVSIDQFDVTTVVDANSCGGNAGSLPFKFDCVAPSGAGATVVVR
jgi:hypothetical protein